MAHLLMIYIYIGWTNSLLPALSIHTLTTISFHFLLLPSFIIYKFCIYIGYKGEQDVKTAYKKWGINDFDIPIPAFIDLYMQHLIAPFFVFQVLCLFLWSLDDYWYYSAFTLLMLMFFEGMLCKQRLDGLQTLKAMRKEPILIQVYVPSTTLDLDVHSLTAQ